MTDESPDRSTPAPPTDHTADGDGPHWGTLLRGAGLLVLVVGMIWVAFNIHLPSPATLRAEIEALGWGARSGFVGLYAVVAMTPIPVSVMAITGGVLFGVVEGSILSVIGVMLGCWGAYGAARALGRETVSRLIGSYGPRVEKHLSEAGFQAIFMLRLLPGLPYWPLNYGAGAFGAGQRDFVVASLLACIPGQASLVAIGAFVSGPDLLHGIIVALAWVVVIVMTIWAYRAWRGISRRPLPGSQSR